MKNITILAILILIVSSALVTAASIITLKDFKEQKIQLIDLPTGDALYFNYKQGRHVLILDKIKNDSSIEATLIFYQKSFNDTSINQTAAFITLKQGNRILLDLDQDHKDDLEIKYMRVLYESATLKFEAINISDMDIMNSKLTNSITTVNETSNNLQNNEKNVNIPNFLVGLIIISIIVIVGLSIYWLFTKKKK